MFLFWINYDENKISLSAKIMLEVHGVCGPQAGLVSVSGRGDSLGQGPGGGGNHLGFDYNPPPWAVHTEKDEAAEIQAAWMLSLILGILKTLYTCP